MQRLRRNKTLVPAIALMLLVMAPVLAIAQIAWVKNFDDALKQAATEKKFIVLDISASW